MFVCGEEVAKDFDCLIRNGITHVVNASGINLDNYHEATGQVRRLRRSEGREERSDDSILHSSKLYIEKL